MQDNKLPEKLEKIAKEIEGLTVVEMAQLAKYLEEKFGVSPMITAPVAAASQSASTVSTGSNKEEEKTTFTLILTSAGENKLAVIKAVREILPNLGLMEAKKLVESAPKELLTDVKKETAEDAKKKIEAAGGKVELK